MFHFIPFDNTLKILRLHLPV